VRTLRSFSPGDPDQADYTGFEQPHGGRDRYHGFELLGGFGPVVLDGIVAKAALHRQRHRENIG